MCKYIDIVTPLTSRKVKKATEQAFTSTISEIDFNVTNVTEAGRFLGINIPEDMAQGIEEELSRSFTSPNDIFDARYFIAANLKNIATGEKPLYKIPVPIATFEKFKNRLKNTVI